MKKAEIVQYIRVDFHDILLDGTQIAETMCLDYPDFRRLPSFIRLDGIVLGKSGWNSDRQVAYYRSDVKKAEIAL